MIMVNSGLKGLNLLHVSSINKKARRIYKVIYKVISTLRVNPFSAGIYFRQQISKVDARTERVKHL